MRGTFVPTARAALLVAASAPAALLVAVLVPGAWAAAPALGTLVLLAIMVDALLAGTASEVRLIEPRDVEVGAEAEFTLSARFSDGWQGGVEAALAADPRLVTGGRAEQGMTRSAPRDWHAAIGFRPNRRGTGMVEGLWLRWTGPLGLGARQLHRPLEQPVRVWPNLAAVRSPALQTFLKDAQFGLIARRMRGEGTVFEALAEYQPGMDRRRIGL